MPLLLFVASTKIIQLNYRNATLLPTAVQAHGAAKKKLFNYHATAISGRSPDGGFLRLRLFLCLILPTAFLPPFDELNRWTTVWINELVKNAFNVFLMTCQVGTHPPTKSVAPAAAKAAAKSKGHPIFLQFKFVLFRPCARYTQTNSSTIGCPRKKSEIFVFKPLVLIFIYFYKENDFFLWVYSSISHIRASIFAAVLCWGHCK